MWTFYVPQVTGSLASDTTSCEWAAGPLSSCCSAALDPSPEAAQGQGCGEGQAEEAGSTAVVLMFPGSTEGWIPEALSL